jgi:hypothetical protein
MLEIDAEQLLEGFVHSFNSLLLPAEPWVDRAQETHAIVDYFRRLGWALGYYPWCEAGRRDLEWYGRTDATDEDYSQVVLHLESENDATRLSATIAKLAQAPRHAERPPHIRIGLVWAKAATHETPSREDLTRMAAYSAHHACELLLVIRCEQVEATSANLQQAGRAWLCPVKAWRAKQGTCDPLDHAQWYILWPEDGGLQTAWWPQSPSVLGERLARRA